MENKKCRRSSKTAEKMCDMFQRQLTHNTQTPAVLSFARTYPRAPWCVLPLPPRLDLAVYVQLPWILQNELRTWAENWTEGVMLRKRSFIAFNFSILWCAFPSLLSPPMLLYAPLFCLSSLSRAVLGVQSVGHLLWRQGQGDTVKKNPEVPPADAQNYLKLFYIPSLVDQVGCLATVPSALSIWASQHHLSFFFLPFRPVHEIHFSPILIY